MTTGRKAAALLLLACLSPCAAVAQGPDALPSFLDQLDAAGRRFEDVRVAVAEGYRKLGPDFPGMGEHWVNPGLVISGELDPERPPVIGYTLVDGRRHLVSFAYTRVLGPGEVPPPGPFPRSAWHDHTGGVDEESLLLSGPMSVHGEDNGFRLSMVHVWLGVENPDGVLAQNNWALPFLRAGVAAPAHPSSEAARALALTTEEGMAFYEQLLREGVGLQGPELEAAMAAFREAGGTEADMEALEGVWNELWTRLEERVSPEAFEAMGVLRG